MEESKKTGDTKTKKSTSANPDQFTVSEKASALLSHDNILSVLQSFNAATQEEELAVEFVRSYAQFMQEITAHDREKSIIRSDFEIKDLVSNVNMMLQKKNEYIFSTMVMKSPAHYKSIQKYQAKSEHAG